MNILQIEELVPHEFLANQYFIPSSVTPYPTIVTAWFNSSHDGSNVSIEVQDIKDNAKQRDDSILQKML
ncbi:hypothetical protein Sjap_020013 [Stephania japonica]|uniref:Uncharacterized protein n=1 Tax=Stephania japonica TaxID=461633 RepID=A0AAP0F8W0_9MAGN